MTLPHLPRRSLLAVLGAGVIGPILPVVAFAQTGNAEGRDGRRFALLILRGAMDGLTAVPPLADPDLLDARGGQSLILPAPGEPNGPLALDGRFGLHPAMAPVHDLWAAREMAIIHAVASPYRERSHFDAQALLEQGGSRVGSTRDGWMNRALAVLGAGRWQGLAVSSSVPIVMNGAAQVTNWVPDEGHAPREEFLASVARMYERDRQFSEAFSAGVATNGMANEALGGTGRGRRNFAQVSQAAGRIMAADNGPNLAVLELGGWDTHQQQGGAQGRHANALRNLAEGIAGLRLGLGERWGSTVVVAATEFGRTVRVNGTGGTDHGTATALFLAGGAVSGGRVLADWPGLARGALFHGRDLAPTTDIRSVLKGVLGDHLRITNRDLEGRIFPDSQAARTTQGLIRS